MWKPNAVLLAIGVGVMLSLSSDAPAIYIRGERPYCSAELPAGDVQLGSSVAISGRLVPDIVQKISQMPEPPVEIVMHNSPGGYVAPARELAQSGVSIRITGESCASACAIILVESPHACVEDTVREIKFHSLVTRHCRWGELVTKVSVRKTLDFVATVREPLRERLWHMAEADMLYAVSMSDFLSVYPEKRCK